MQFWMLSLQYVNGSHVLFFLYTSLVNNKKNVEFEAFETTIVGVIKD